MMKSVDSQKEHILSALFLYSVITLFSLPLLPKTLQILSIAFFVIISLLCFLKYKPPFKWTYFLINSSLYLLYIISLLYTEDLIYGFKKLESAAALIIFPLGFSLAPKMLIEQVIKKLNLLSLIFVIAVVTLNLFLFSIAFNSITDLTNIICYEEFINAYKGIFKIHSLYLAMLDSIAILMIFHLLKTQRFLYRGLVLFIGGIFLMVVLIVLLKKAAVFALIAAATFMVIKFKLIRTSAFYITLIISVITTIMAFPESSQKFNELFTAEKTEVKIKSASIQTLLTECNMDAIWGAGIFGYGIGDGKTQLIQCYAAKDSLMAQTNYNSHNQYVSIIIKAGFVAGAIFIIFLLYNIFRGLKTGAALSVAIVLFYMIMMFTENILERQDGVIYFSLFINFLYFSNRRDQINLDK